MGSLQTVLVSLAVWAGAAGCCAYRGVSQASLIHVRDVRVSESPGAGTNGVEVAAGGVRLLAGRLVVVAENVYMSVGGGTAASNDVAGELSIPLTK